MLSRKAIILATSGAILLVSMAVLHGSGYGYVARTIAESQLPAFLKRILPPLYLYPSALMLVLASVVLLALRQRQAAPFVFRVVSGIIAANSVLGFVLGGFVPGGVLLLVAGLFWYLSNLLAAEWKQGEVDGRAQ